MATIKEAYCSPEVTKLLKEKGFDYQGFDYIDFEGEIIRQDRPTLQMAMKWLREVYKIYIVISPVSNKGYGAILCDVGDFDDFNYIGETDYFFHPEEAVEAGIKYTLENLI